jgi:hypothetical protein
MQREKFLKVCNKLTHLEKLMFQKRHKWHNDNKEYEDLLDEYVRLSKQIVMGKEEEDGGEKFLFDEDDLI